MKKLSTSPKIKNGTLYKQMLINVLHFKQNKKLSFIARLLDECVTKIESLLIWDSNDREKFYIDFGFVTT